jgi:dihydrofolate reductase
MKVVLVFVSTLNGKITRGGDPEVKHWSSEGDKEHYASVWRDSRLVVMGSNTWKQNIITPSSSRLIIVMTHEPEKFTGQEMPGQLEFSSMSPAELVSDNAKKGADLMTVVGGPLIATSFLKDSLIHEIWLTIEPRLFGTGLNLIHPEELDVKLHLIDFKQVNEEGTLITRYRVI